MASFKQLDRNNWQVSFYCKDYLGNNKKYKKTGFSTKKEAKEYSENFISLHSGESDVLFSDAFNEFLAYKNKNLKISSIKRIKNISKKIDNYFGSIKLNEVSEKIVFKFLDKFTDTPVNLKKIKALLSEFFMNKSVFQSNAGGQFSNKLLGTSVTTDQGCLCRIMAEMATRLTLQIHPF